LVSDIFVDPRSALSFSLMTGLERNVVVGRAYVDLKRARSNAAVLRGSLDAYARDLQAAGKLVSGFASNPRLHDVSLPVLESLNRDLRRLPEPVKMAALIDALVEETRLAERLRGLVDQF
jgi:hypothetical protein